MWSHKKYPKRSYIGMYLYLKGERVFELSCIERKHRITFESHQAAKSLGWKYARA